MRVPTGPGGCAFTTEPEHIYVCMIGGRTVYLLFCYFTTLCTLLYQRDIILYSTRGQGQVCRTHTKKWVYRILLGVTSKNIYPYHKFQTSTYSETWAHTIVPYITMTTHLGIAIHIWSRVLHARNTMPLFFYSTMTPQLNIYVISASYKYGESRGDLSPQSSKKNNHQRQSRLSLDRTRQSSSKASVSLFIHPDRGCSLWMRHQRPLKGKDNEPTTFKSRSWPLLPMTLPIEIMC